MPLEDIAVSRQPIKVEAAPRSLQGFKDAIANQAAKINLPGGLNLGKLPSFKGKKQVPSEEAEEFEEKPRRGREEAERPARRPEEKPRRGREEKPPRRFEDERPARYEEEDMPPRRQRERMPQPPPRLPNRGPRPEYLPGQPGQPEQPAQPASESKGKSMLGGFFAKMGLGKSQAKQPAQPEQLPAEKSAYDDEYDARGRRRYEDEEDDMPRRRRYEEDARGRRRYDDEEDDMPRRRRFEDEEDDTPRRRRNEERPRPRKAKQPPVEAISSSDDFSTESESEPEPIVPEGKPTPFNHGKRIPYIPPPFKSTNPFARSCGNPFAVVTATPPTPTAPPAPGAAYDAYLPKKEEEKIMPTPRPGFNPFAAKQKGSLAVMEDWKNRRPAPRPGFNPFDGERPRTIVINGKARTNPFA